MSGPSSNPSTGYRGFIERLRLARLERGLSIADMSDAVGLTFRLAYEFETLNAPLPFEWLEVWCQTVGVPFADYLAIYRADQREWEAALEAKEAAQNGPYITSTETGVAEVPTFELPNSNVSLGSGWLSPLRAALARVVSLFRSLFSTP